MFKVLKTLKGRLILFLAVLGPSTITTMAGNDGAGVITYSLAGARTGYPILFILPFLTLLYAVTQEMGSRVAIVTGRGLADLIRERFGIKTSIFIFSLLLIANFGTVLTNVAALKTASSILHVQTLPFISLLILCAILLVTLTNYEKSQKLFLTGIIVYLTYIFSAFKGNPDWGVAVKSMIIPSSKILSRDYLVMAIAVVGTTITPWGQFFVQSYMKDKNLALEQVSFARVEAYFGSLLSNMFTFFIIIATASTLFVRGIYLNSGEEAAMAIAPFAGKLSTLFFGIGLVNAAVIGMIIVSLSSAYVFSEFFGFEGSLDSPYDRGRIFYSIFILSLVLAALIVSLPSVSLFKIVFYTQSLNAILLPLILYFLLKILNDRELMGKFVNNRFDNGVAIFASILIVLASFAAVLMTILR